MDPGLARQLPRPSGRPMTLRPCMSCGDPTTGTRCNEHTVPRKRKPLPSAHSRGYDSAWNRLSKRARALQPWCSDCGSTENLQADHTPEAWARKAIGRSIRLQDIDVVCEACNHARGDARGERPQRRPSGTNRPHAKSALHTRGGYTAGVDGHARSQVPQQVLRTKATAPQRISRSGVRGEG